MMTTTNTAGSATMRPALARDLENLPTVGEALLRSAERHPRSDAIVYPDQRTTYAQLHDAAVSVARSLVSLGVQPGERVGILMPNCPEFLEIFFGCHFAGAIPVTVNARYKAKELRHVTEDAGLVALITTDLVADYVPFVDLLAEAFKEHPPTTLRTRILLGSSSPEGYVNQSMWSAAAEDTSVSEVKRRAAAVGLDDIAVIMYTSGTTSSPRGCPLTHRSFVRTAYCVADRLEITGQERFWDPLPLFHMGGLLPSMATLLHGGAVISLVHFDADIALDQLADEQATFAYPAFPTITQSLIHHPRFADLDLTSIRGILDTAPPDTLRQVQEAFPHASVVTSYGLTEASGVITYSHLDDPIDKRIGTTGRAFPGMEVRAIDPDTGRVCEPGVSGELRVRGPGMFTGYLNSEEYTASRTDRDGFLCTGDLGMLDEEGRISYTGRLKDMLKVGGENVAAAEIEAHLALHEAVKIAAVVGVPDTHLVEVPVAYVETVLGASVTEGELIAHCRGQLASFKIPRRVWFIDEWPMSTTKIQKFRLRDDAQARVSEAEASDG